MPLASTDLDALVFDAYGTLLDIDSLVPACAQVTRDPAACVALWRGKQLEYTFLRALMGRYADFWQVTGEALDYALARLGLTADAATRERLRAAWLELAPYPDAAPTLRRLAGRPLAVLSNGSPHMLEAALAHAGLRAHLTHVLSVDAVRTYKPDPRVYELAPRTLGLPPHRLLFVSGNAWDAAGAASYGLRVAWLNRGGAPFEVLGQQPDWEIATLEALADALARG